MRKKLWAFILVTILLLQAYSSVAFAVSEKEITASELSFCNSDVPHGGAGNGVNTTITSGTSRAPTTSTPNSIYEQVGTDGSVMSRTFYDSNGNAFSRQDFIHPHFDKATQQYLQPHEHNTTFNQNGQPTGTTVNPVPPGY